MKISIVDERYIKTPSDRRAVEDGCYVDADAAKKVNLFFRQFLKHTKAPFDGKPFELLEWQWANVIFPLYAWRMPDGTRRFNRVGIVIPKKNGKSTLVAGLSLYELICGGDGSQIVLAAADKYQASIIFNEVCDMIERDPKLTKSLNVTRSKKLIRYKKTQSTLEPLSADVKKKEGLNPSVVVIDELHTQHDRRLWDTLKYATAARSSYLRVWLSTAGEFNPDALWSEQFQYMRDVRDGKVIDINTLPVIYEATEEDDWKSEETWKKCNPSYGLTLNLRQFQEDFVDATRSPNDEHIFKRYRLNLPTKTVNNWLPSTDWTALADDSINVENAHELTKGATVFAGLDLSLTHDFTALVVCIFTGETVKMFSYFWLPESVLNQNKIDKKNFERYRVWANNGKLKFSSTMDVMDYDELSKDIVAICKIWNISEICIDNWNVSRIGPMLHETLKQAKCQTVISKISANSRNIALGTLELERLIRSRQLTHSNNPVMNWMFDNVRIERHFNGNQVISKGKAVDKIDGIFAGLVGVSAYLAYKEANSFKPTSRYENEDS